MFLYSQQFSLDRLINGTMFDKNLLDEFYKFEDSNDFEVKTEVKEAYFVFIKEFVTLVSPHWKSHLKCIKNRDLAKFGEDLTPSDEVFTFWFLKYNYDKEKRNADIIKATSEKLFKEKQKEQVVRGRHKSLEYYSEYLDIHEDLVKHRKNTRAYEEWQNIFFDQHLSELKKKSPRRTSRACIPERAAPHPEGYGLPPDNDPIVADTGPPVFVGGTGPSFNMDDVGESQEM